MGKTNYAGVVHPCGSRAVAIGRTNLNVSKLGFLPHVYPNVVRGQVTGHNLAGRLSKLNVNVLKAITGKKRSKAFILQDVNGMTIKEKEEILRKLNIKARNKLLSTLP